MMPHLNCWIIWIPKFSNSHHHFQLKAYSAVSGTCRRLNQTKHGRRVRDKRSVTFLVTVIQHPTLSSLIFHCPCHDHHIMATSVISSTGCSSIAFQKWIRRSPVSSCEGSCPYQLTPRTTLDSYTILLVLYVSAHLLHQITPTLIMLSIRTKKGRYY